MCPEFMMSDAMEIARDELCVVGLELHDAKCQVWAKSGTCPTGCERWWRGAEGFVVVGAPFGRIADAAEVAEGRQDLVDHDAVEVALGTPQFTHTFLEKQEQKVQDLLGTLPGQFARGAPTAPVAVNTHRKSHRKSLKRLLIYAMGNFLL